MTNPPTPCEHERIGIRIKDGIDCRDCNKHWSFNAYRKMLIQKGKSEGIRIGEQLGVEKAFKALGKPDNANPCMKCGSIQCAICSKDLKGIKKSLLSGNVNVCTSKGTMSLDSVSAKKENKPSFLCESDGRAVGGVPEKKENCLSEGMLKQDFDGLRHSWVKPTPDDKKNEAKP